MNKIFKVIYSKTRHCYVVVSELAKSHCKTTQSHTARSKTALTAAVLLALGAFSFVGMPVVQAADGTESLRNNDFVGANDYYWYYDEKEKNQDQKWKTYQYKATDAFNNRSRHDLPNYQGGGAKFPGAVTAGLYAQAGQQTVTIGDRNAGQSKGSVFIGEHSGYNNGNNDPAGMKDNYVTSVGFQSDATGWGSIAIGSNAKAENSKMESQVVEEVGDAHTSGTVSDDTYGIKENPTIQGASVALGYNAHSKDGNIAIGSYSDATSTDKNDSYVSVGNANLKRRITNVADGASASDVATVGQLQALSDKVGVYDAGFGIEIASDKDNKTNTISLNRNLGTNYTDKAHHGDEKVTVAVDDTGLVLGGYAEDEKGNKKNPAVTYGATGDDSVTVGGMNSLASGKGSVVTGGVENIASGATAVAIGGNNNDAIGTRSAVLGGLDNTAFGDNSMVSGGVYNVAGGIHSAVLGGFSNYALGTGTTSIGGYGKDYGTGYDSSVNGDYSVGVAGGSTGKDAKHALAAGNQAVVTTENGTAIGYQATTDEAKTIAFGHDVGDVSGYTIEWNKLPEGQVNADGTANDYTKAPKSVTPTTYKDAYYNRLVKVADGQDAHDVVVMEQLKPYTKSDASNVGANLKTYTVGEDGETITEADATADQKKANKDAWGTALGADTFSEGTPEKATDASTSDQLVTGKTLYNYDAPVAETGKKLNYVSANNTTGQNLSALDAQVKANADTLNDKTHNIKYYSVDENLPKIDGYTNEGNDGAKGMGSIAAGFNTHADGIASTVAGSYSGVINSKTDGLDLRGATALSYGTFNINQNTDATKEHSGVANSIIGQVNMTKDSNAAIIYGAGNIVTDSYRPIDKTKAAAILGSVNDPAKLGEAMKDAVKTSGGQVMVMGGGNTVDKAYMSQVVGVGNTVKGNQVQNTKSEWVTDTSDTAIKDYDAEKSSQYNYVDGFNNEVINGKHDYVIGANNKLSGDSYDNDTVRPIKRSNKSNIVIGDNHTLTREQNTVIIGSSDTENTQTKARDAVIIGHNANATNDTGADNAVAIGRSAKATGGNAVTIGVNTSAGENSITIGSESSTISGSNIAIGRYAKVDGYNVTNAVALGKLAEAHVTDGVAIGSGSIATVAGLSAEGYDPVTGKDSTDATATWKATNAAVSIGKADGTVTRQINGVAAGTNDTDAVNVAQIKKLASINASNIGTNLQYGADGTTAATDTDKTKNKEAWATAIGTGTVTKDDDGSKQMVTGKTVYDALHGGLDNITVGKDGQNGKDGSIGIAGQNGKDGYTMTIIKTEKGADGVDGKDGITRVVYQDKDGNGKHTFATLDDGLKFKGDDSTVIAKKLNEQLNITGDADSTKLTDKNIGVNSSTDGLKIQLAKDLTSITSISGSTDTNGAKITLDENDKNISVNGGSIKDVASNLTKDGKIIKGSANNAASISDVQTLVQQGVDNGYTHGNGITIQKDGTSGKNVISVNQGDGLKFDNGKLAVNTGDGLTVDETTKALKIKTSDSNLKVDQNGIGLNNVITIGTSGTDAHPITIDSTKGEVSGLNNTSWDSQGNYSGSTKAATESQVAAAVKDAIKQAGDNDTHVAAGSYAVNSQHQISMNLVDKNNNNKGTVTITDVAKASEMGDVSKLDKGVQNATGTTTVVDAINNVNTKIGDQKYSQSNTSGSNKYVQDADSITSAIGKLDGAIQTVSDASSAANNIQGGDNIDVTDIKDNNDKVTGHQVSLKADISLNSVTTKTTTTDTLTVNKSANIGGVTIENKTISGLDDTKIEKDSKKAVNAGTIYNELRPATDGTYIKSTNTTAQNLTSLDTQVRATHDLINSDGKTIKIGGSDAATKIDVSGKDSSGNSTTRVITGVQTDPQDAASAANVGYVNDVTAASTQQVYRDMNRAYGSLNNNINRAAAGSNALAALHPLDFDPADKASFAVGYGHYRNANAAAVGAFYQPNANTMVNMGISLGNGDPGFNAGVSFKIGKGSAYNGVSKAEMAQTIHDQATEISAIKADDAAKDKRIDALEKENQEMKKQIQEILARLNG